MHSPRDVFDANIMKINWENKMLNSYSLQRYFVLDPSLMIRSFPNLWKSNWGRGRDFIGWREGKKEISLGVYMLVKEGQQSTLDPFLAIKMDSRLYESM